MRKVMHTITKNDVGKRFIDQGYCECCGRRNQPMALGGAIGFVQPRDVGKRLIGIDGILYMESQTQYEKRIEEN